jgi:hypothetical protein
MPEHSSRSNRTRLKPGKGLEVGARKLLDKRMATGKSIEYIRFYEIKNEGRQENTSQIVKPTISKRKPASRMRKMTPAQKQEVLRKMKKALIEGTIIKVVLADSGFHPCSGMRFFKKQTGLTMKQFRALYASR